MFTDRVRRDLADHFWDRLRNEGEPTFAEYLAELPSDELKRTAIDLLEEAEKLGDLEATLRDGLGYFKTERLRREEKLKLRTLVSRSQEDDKQAEILRDLMQRVQQRNTRPQGPRT